MCSRTNWAAKNAMSVRGATTLSSKCLIQLGCVLDAFPSKKENRGAAFTFLKHAEFQSCMEYLTKKRTFPIVTNLTIKLN